MTLSRAQRVVVVDASAAIPFLEGEASWTDRWSAWIADGDLLLTSPVFPFEVANALLRGSSVVDAREVPTLVSELFATGFEVADRGAAGLSTTLALATHHGLTVYDAAYLDLAIDVDGALATLDRDLRAAATAEGIDLVP